MSSKGAFQMPRGKRKKAHELTGDEAMERLFSKTVVKHLKKVDSQTLMNQRKRRSRMDLRPSVGRSQVYNPDTFR